MKVDEAMNSLYIYPTEFSIEMARTVFTTTIFTINFFFLNSEMDVVYGKIYRVYNSRYDVCFRNAFILMLYIRIYSQQQQEKKIFSSSIRWNSRICVERLNIMKEREKMYVYQNVFSL